MPDEIEVSFVMPCLDEAETLEACIRAAQEAIETGSLKGEVVIADNGSTDGSQEIATRMGARVVEVPERGYGSALMGGFQAARGRFLIMGDADESYDFREALPMIEALRAGADLVMGSRFRGRIEPGAMPWSHRWIGNPVLSFIGRLFFPSPVSDFHCGLRGLSRKAFEALNLRTTGMEFASEMVVKASAHGLRIAEVPITLHPDGRSRAPHLRRWRDGWRHLRFLMTLSPRWTLFLPGLVLLGVGALLLALVGLGPLALGSVTFDVHTMLAGSLFVIVGYQAVTTAIAARIYAFEEELGPPVAWMGRAFEVFTLERGLLAGAALAGVGAFLIGQLTWHWAQTGFGPLETSVTLRPMVLGSTFIAVGIQTLLMSFLFSMLGIRRRRSP
ncbi:MAG: dolichol-P-glucose synthetase [Deltaproteobacteria bacterium]|jgi:hypothetical protein|nr:dolichol-P-glucose synthetase [Deltaproteobacteria bacterium]